MNREEYHRAVVLNNAKLRAACEEYLASPEAAKHRNIAANNRRTIIKCAERMARHMRQEMTPIESDNFNATYSKLPLAQEGKYWNAGFGE